LKIDAIITEITIAVILKTNVIQIKEEIVVSLMVVADVADVVILASHVVCHDADAVDSGVGKFLKQSKNGLVLLFYHKTSPLFHF